MSKAHLLKNYSKFIKNLKKNNLKYNYGRILGILIAILAVVAFSIKNKESLALKKEIKKNNCSVCSPVPPPTINAYNSTARIDVCGIKCFMTGSYLYWQTKEKGTELAIQTHAENSIYRTKVIPQHSNYQNGFKIGLGFYSKHDNWSLFSQYTRYYSKNSGHKTVDGFDSDPASINNLVVPWIHVPNPASPLIYYAIREAKSRLKLHLNLIDLELSRPYFVGKKLTFRPFIGAKGGLINQRYLFQGILSINSPSLENPKDVPIFSRSFSNSWLIGPRMGIDTNWLLGCNFRLIGNGAINIFYQHFKINLKNGIQDESVPQNLHIKYLAVEKPSYFNSSFETLLGFGWGKYLSNNKCHLDLLAGYEIQLFLNQNMIRSYVDSSTTSNVIDGSASNLMLHGLTISTKIDF